MKHIILLLALSVGGSLITSPAAAQSAPSAYTSATRYDAMGRVTGTIAPDPDGAGPLKYAATRTTYDLAGRPIKEETGELADWHSEAVEPKNWPTAAASPATGFKRLSSVDTSYDVLDRKIKEVARGSDDVIVSVVQYSYDSVGRLECTAQRMNPAIYGSLPASACTLGTQGSFGPDRITKNVYDAAGQLTMVQKAYGTPLQEDYATYTYSLNGKQTSLTDARGFKASMTYDGHDRQVKWNFPSPTTPGVVSTTDYEQYGYDANGNRTSLRKRDGSVITYQYDALNRNTVKIVPARTGLAATHTRDVYYGYDLRGLQTYARFDSGAATSDGVTTAYDGFGRMASSALTMDGVTRTLGYVHDNNGNRTELTWPDAQKTTYAYDGLDRMTTLYLIKNGSPIDMVNYGYNDRGLRATQTGRYGQATAFGYDPVGRLNALSHDIGGTAQDVAFTYGYTPASQIAQQTRNNDSYAWTGHFNVDRSYAANGLNQYTAAGPAAFAYDANGNLTSDGSTTYIYDIENRLVSASGTKNAALRYDPLGRLYETVGGGNTTRFLTDGDELVAEYDGAGTLLRRHAHGKNVDDPVITFEGSGITLPRLLHTDHQGSVIAITASTGNAVATNSYDEYGIPTTSAVGLNLYGRFGYTGQAWLPELGMYHYKARIYSPTLGRFLQTDPIGYEDQVNLYAYVGNDPINSVDPSGMFDESAIQKCMSCTLAGGIWGNALPLERGIGNTVYNAAPDGSDGITLKEGATLVGKAALQLAPGGAAVDCIFISECDRTDKVLAVVDLVPGLGKLGKLGQLRKLGRACGCVVAGTLVSTPTGLLAIETLKAGDLVYAYDVTTGELMPQAVLELIETEPKPAYNVILRAPNGKRAQFEATDDHPWLNAAKVWRNTDELTAGEWLIADDGERFEVIEVGLSGKVEVAYTLTVDTFHTFIMGEAGLVVHNACPKIQDLKKAGSNRRADEIARQHGYRDAHDAKAGRGDSRVNIYTDKDGNAYLSDGVSPPEPL